MTGKDEKMGRRDFLKIASGGIAAILNFRKFPLVYSGTTKKVDSFDMSTAAAKDILKEDGIIVMGSDGCTGIAFNPNDPDYVYFSQLDGDSTRIMASDCRDFNRSKPEQACFMTRDMQIYDPRVLPETMSSISFSPDGYKMAMVNMKKNEIHIHDFTDSRNVRVKRIDKYEALITLRNYKEDFSPFWWDDGEILFLRKPNSKYERKELFSAVLEEGSKGEEIAAEKKIIMEIGKYSQISDPCKINYADNQNGILMAKTFGNYMKGGRRSVITKADLADGFREIPLISDERLSELLSPVYFNEPMADKMALLRREDYNNPGGSLWICETGGRHYSFREEMKKKGEKKIVNQIDTGEEKYRKIALSLDMKTIAGINDKGQLSIIRLGLKTGNVHAVGESYG